jgi:hypothetical protein
MPFSGIWFENRDGKGYTHDRTTQWRRGGDSMKRILAYSGLILIFAAVLSLTGCFIFLGDPGADGKAYVQVQHSSSYGLLAAIDGFPSGWYTDTNYELTAGHHDGAYVLYYTVYNAPFYDVYFNDGTLMAGYSSTSAAVSAYYSTYFATYANSIGFDITINAGEAGTFLEAGADGADIYYTIWLDWNPSSSLISHNAVARAPVKTIENPDGSIVQEITKGKYTIRFTVKKGGGAAPDLPPARDFPLKEASN